MNKNLCHAIGRMAALSITAETAVFAFSLVWGLLFHTQFDKNLGYAASLLLAMSVVVMTSCFYASTQEPLRIFGLLTLAASLLYAPFCIGNYFVQLSVVALNPLNLSSDVLKAIEFVPGSPTFALDMLGYGFLCLATLAAGFALPRAEDRALRAMCWFHGALALPTLAAPIMSGIFRSTGGQSNDIGSYVLLFWCAIFMPIGLLFMRYFKAGQERSENVREGLFAGA